MRTAVSLYNFYFLKRKAMKIICEKEELTVDDVSIPGKLRPLFEAMAADHTIKSVTLCRGNNRWQTPQSDFTIHNFQATEYYVSKIPNKRPTNGIATSDYIFIEGPDICVSSHRNKEDQKNDQDRDGFYMSWVRSFEL
jgi:hypothetical protein